MRKHHDRPGVDGGGGDAAVRAGDGLQSQQRRTVCDLCVAGREGLGTICLNGPTARKGVVGDKVIIFCYASYSEEELKQYKPKVVKVDEKNRIEAIRSGI